MKRTITFLFAFAVAGSLLAQSDTTARIGFADIDYIFSKMPESKQIEAELNSLQAQLKKQLDTQVEAFQKKLAEYQQFGTTVPDAVRQNTERELRQMNDNIEQLRDDSQQNLQKRNNELMQPVYVKVGKAIADVARENGYTMVLSSQIGGIDVVLYGAPHVDLSDIVLKKLGVNPQASVTPTAPK